MGIDTERVGAVLTIRLNRPDVLNALDPVAMAELRDALVGFRDDDSLAVAIIAGEGERAFSAGADLSQTPASDHPFAAGYYAPLKQGMRNGAYVRALVFDDLHISKPLIAAINGHALGGGLEIALQCDLRIASTTATFGLPEVRWATVPGAGGVSNLLRAVPRAVAMKLILTGDRIDAHEALRVGLVSDVVAPDELMTTALEIADRIAGNGPLAVRSVTSLAHRTQDLPLSQSVAIEQLMWGSLRDTADRAEGRDAFAERRAPNYQGK